MTGSSVFHNQKFFWYMISNSDVICQALDAALFHNKHSLYLAGKGRHNS